jgi:hypothetical protein
MPQPKSIKYLARCRWVYLIIFGSFKGFRLGNIGRRVAGVVTGSEGEAVRRFRGSPSVAMRGIVSLVSVC